MREREETQALLRGRACLTALVCVALTAMAPGDDEAKSRTGWHVGVTCAPPRQSWPQAPQLPGSFRVSSRPAPELLELAAKLAALLDASIGACSRGVGARCAVATLGGKRRTRPFLWPCSSGPTCPRLD